MSEANVLAILAHSVGSGPQPVNEDMQPARNRRRVCATVVNFGALYIAQSTGVSAVTKAPNLILSSTKMAARTP